MRYLGGALLFTSTISSISCQAVHPDIIPSYPTTLLEAQGNSGDATVTPSGTKSPTSSSNDGSSASLPLPSLATIITGTIESQTIVETFVPHIFPEYTTISTTITTTTSLTSGGGLVTVVVGPSGVGWAPYREPSNVPELVPPSILPPSAVAAYDDFSASIEGVSSTLVLPRTGVSSSSIPLQTGISASDPSVNTSSRQSLTRTGPTLSSVSLRTSPRSSSLANSTTIPLGTGVSSSNLSSSRISLGTRFSGFSRTSSGSSAPSLSNGGAPSSGITSGIAPPTSTSQKSLLESTTVVAIVPVSYVTTAFNNPSQTITTLSLSGQAAVIYSKETFPGLSKITSPTTIQTSVVETKNGGKTCTFVGGIVIGPGGVYWGPPGLPSLPPFPGISPPCIWPFCTGGGGGGGSNPPGDPDPPPPYTPDDPNTPDSNDPKTQTDISNQNSQPSSTQHPSTLSNPSSSSSASSVTSSASCSAQTVTDYWVNCASGALTSCSTYSSAAVSGCSVTAATSTTASACPNGASASPDPTMAGFDYSNEYPVLNPGFSSDVQWMYTVANIVDSGVIVGSASAVPSSVASGNQTTLASTPSRISSSAIPGSGVLTTLLTTTHPPSSTIGGSGSMTSTVAKSFTPSFCENFANPDNGVPGECQCSSGTLYTTLPIPTGQSNQCGYTVLRSPAPTPSPTASSNSNLYIYTDSISGPVIACKSSSVGNGGGVLYAVCEGDSTNVGLDASIYSIYTMAQSSAASVAAVSAVSASSAAAVPTGSCVFSDKALYWTFEVYNIKNWAGENGDRLHNQVKGCGDLTGWKWSTGNRNGDQHAYFNLPFFIKPGCVERSIASAGGPSGLSCSGQGTGKKRQTFQVENDMYVEADGTKRREFTVSAPRIRGLSDARALQISKRETLSDIKTSLINEQNISTAPKRLNARTEFEKLHELDSRNLVKRGCLDWMWPGKNIPKEWWCNAVLPGVDSCTQAIQQKGVVGRFPSMFYTSWGGIGDKTYGVQGTKLWASQNVCGRFVDFDGIVVRVYHYVVESAVLKPFGEDGLNLSDEEQKQIMDPFLKNLSQAFAEQSAGEAYVFTPQGVDFQPNSAWTGWEYPALTRNKRITKIWQVALDTSDPSQFKPPGGKPQGVKTLLWTQGDPPSGIAPKGTRQGTLPAQIPQDQIPENWESSI